MTAFLAFLRRFRRVLLLCALLFLVLFAAAYLLSPAALRFLTNLLPGERFYQMAVAEGLWARLEIALCIAAAACAPVLLTLILRRIRKEELWLVPCAALLFLAGTGFCLYILLPSALRLLTGLLPYELHLAVGTYVSFCLGLSAVTGLLFEEPLVMYLLYRLGIVKVTFLRANRKKVYLAALILLALLTPTGDAVSLCVAMLPFAALYELAILWLALLDRRKEDRHEG